MNKIIKYLIILALTLLLYGCKDEELTLPKIPYTGNEIRTDGYYYSYYANNSTPPEEYIVTLFLYRNGVILSAGAYDERNLNALERKMLERYESLQNEKIGWGVFIVKNNKIEYEQWSTSAGGGLPVFRNFYNIENDTTLRGFTGNIYHFKQFSPKPDSTVANKWIK
jgi:hypothetical protein